MIILAIITVTLFPLSLALFRLAVNHARKAGTLSKY